MSEINDIQLEQAEKIQENAKWDCGEHEDFSQEHIEKCLDEMLAAYMSDERNYVVDCAEIECTEMSDAVFQLEYMNGKTRLRNRGNDEIVVRGSVPPEKEPEEGSLCAGVGYCLGMELDMTKVRRLYALHAKEADDNGIRYATVIDTTCLRDVNEGTGHLMSPAEGKLSNPSCIISCGNCGILKESDIDEIEKRLDESKEYGTCYSLIKPVWEWVNPLCAESVSGNCNHTIKDVMFGSGPFQTSSDRTDHHKVMRFDTRYGLKEGLTMLSTLLCRRGGVITIKVHGQIYLESVGKVDDEIDENVNVKAKILELLEMDNGLELIEEYIKKIKLTYPDYDSFLELLAQEESRGTGDYEADNGFHFGRYQIGWGTLKQIGYTNEKNEWTELANSLGVYDLETFKKNEVAQEVAILFALRWDYQQILDYGDDKYIGEEVNGVDVTLSGLIAAGHLVGTGGVHKGFTREKAWDDVYDGNGTKATTYMNNMKGLDIKGILVGIE